MINGSGVSIGSADPTLLLVLRSTGTLKKTTAEVTLRRSSISAANTEAFTNALVTRLVFALQILQQAATLTNHHEKTTTAMEVVVMFFHVLGEVFDPFSQDCNLDFGGTGVTVFLSVFFDQLSFAFSSNRHQASFRL